MKVYLIEAITYWDDEDHPDPVGDVILAVYNTSEGAIGYIETKYPDAELESMPMQLGDDIDGKTVRGYCCENRYGDSTGLVIMEYELKGVC